MKVITIGRSEEGNDVVINDPMVSRHHLQIVQYDDGSYRLSDLGSTNGTYVNEQRMTGEFYLGEKDIVRIGKTIIPWRQYFDSGFGTHVDMEQSSPALSHDSKVMPVEKHRHGFVTFWLWLGVIANVITIAFSIIKYQQMKLISEGFDNASFSKALGSHLLIMQIVAAIAGISLIVCYAKILNWKRSGFWGAVIVSVVLAIINVFVLNLIEQDYASIGVLVHFDLITSVISTPISLVILWAILQIKKEGISCWKHLE